MQSADFFKRLYFVHIQSIFRVSTHTIGLVQRESRQYRLFSDTPEAAGITPLGSHRHSRDGGWLQEGLSPDRRLNLWLESLISTACIGFCGHRHAVVVWRFSSEALLLPRSGTTEEPGRSVLHDLNDRLTD